MEIESLRDRDGTFDPILVPKKDISAIEGKVLEMYARGIAKEKSLKSSKIFMNFHCHTK